MSAASFQGLFAKRAQRRQELAPGILPLYAQGLGHKTIAKQLELSPRIVRTILIEQGVWRPGSLHSGERHIQAIQTARSLTLRTKEAAKPAWVREVKRRKKTERARRNHTKYLDLPLFVTAAALRKKRLQAWTPEKQAAYMARYYSDIQFRLRNLLRKRINKVVQYGQKSAGTMQLLGCSMETFILWIEHHFKDGMTWENYGKVWEIDHEEPCASFDLSDPAQQRECFYFCNLRPLSVEDNRRKSSHWAGKHHRTRNRKIASSTSVPAHI